MNSATAFRIVVMAVLVAAVLIPAFCYGRVSRRYGSGPLIRARNAVAPGRRAPSDLQARIPEFTVEQLVSLRFAATRNCPDGAKSSRRQAHRAQGNQATSQELASDICERKDLFLDAVLSKQVFSSTGTLCLCYYA